METRTHPKKYPYKTYINNIGRKLKPSEVPNLHGGKVRTQKKETKGYQDFHCRKTLLGIQLKNGADPIKRRRSKMGQTHKKKKGGN